MCVPKCYVRRFLKHNSVIWSVYIIKDIEAVERVQRRFIKNLPGFRSCFYPERLHQLKLQSLELRRLLLLTDLVWCYKYKLVFGIVDMDTADFRPRVRPAMLFPRHAWHHQTFVS